MPIPDSAVEIGLNRYRSPVGYSATIRWIERTSRKKGKRVRFETIVDLPEVVASHAASTSEKTRWRGVNVSEFGGTVQIFVFARD